jgi:capsular polysaccharide transport system ATP-binding protein
MIVLSGISKVHGVGKGRRQVLDGLEAVFRPQHNYVIFGARGSGKTTLLRIISGVTAPTRGTVRRRGSISLPVGSATSFGADKTGRELAGFFASLYQADAKEVVDFTVAFAQMGNAIDLPIAAMPGSIRASLSYAIGYAIPCDYYLFDESIVYGHGGDEVRRACMAAFEARRKTSATIIATGNVRNAEKLGEIGGVLHGGQLQMFASVGEALEVYHRLDLEKQGSGRSYAQALSLKGGPERAQSYLKQYLQDNNDDPEAYEMLANLSLRVGENADAVTASAAALERGSNSPALHMILAKVAESEGDFAGAIGHAENVLKMDPEHREARIVIARCHERLKNYEEAAAIWTSLSDTGASLRAYLGAENWDAVLETTELLLTDQPNDSRLLAIRARALLELKRWTQLSEVIEVIATRQPQEAINLIYRVVRSEDWSAISTVLRQLRSLNLSAHIGNRTVDLMLRIIERYAVAASAAGRLDEATELLDLVYAIDPERPGRDSVGRDQESAVSGMPNSNEAGRELKTAEEIVRELYELKTGRGDIGTRDLGERSRAVWIAAKAFLAKEQKSPVSPVADDAPAVSDTEAAKIKK